MTQKIQSASNPQFKNWFSLRQGGRRGGMVFIEGLRLCRDAIDAGITVTDVLIADTAGPAVRSFASGLNVNLSVLAESLFRRLSLTRNPQGIALFAKVPDMVRPDRPDSKGLYLVAADLADPGNLGTLIRTADAFKFSAVLVSADSVWPFNDKVVRAAMGSCFHLPIYEFSSQAELFSWLQSGCITIAAADLNGTDLPEQLPGFGGALVIGNEAHGLSSLARSLADLIVSIPLPGQAESLNAASAGAILAYQMRKNRNN